MSEIVRVMKKTPLRIIWNALKESKWGRSYIEKRGQKRLDYMLGEEMPQAYNSEVSKPIMENKVIIIEPRYDFLSNNFQVLYKELTEKYNFDVHVHYLRESFVPKAEYRENCKVMLRDMATAKYVFMNEASRITSCIKPRPETVITQLWHGCGAFKRFGKSTADLIFGASRESMERHPFNKNYTYVTVSSPEVVWAFEEAMDLQNEKGVVTASGVSRTDVFFHEEEMQKARQKLEGLMPASKGKKVILFAPTFRGRVATATTPDCLSVEQFAASLSDEYILLFKHHPVVKERPAIPAAFENSFAMDMSDLMSIEELLFVSDICISDYSSLIFEYSLLERPMLFYAYDLEEYFDWRGFYYDYDELTPGPICTTNEQMIDYIKDIDTSFNRQEIIDFKEKFMSSCDGHSTERIMEMVFGKDLETYRK